MSQLLNAETVKNFRARIEAMTPDERKALVNDLCAAVDGVAKAIVENADAIWAAHAAGVASGSTVADGTRNGGPK